MSNRHVDHVGKAARTSSLVTRGLLSYGLEADTGKLRVGKGSGHSMGLLVGYD